jgi:hypothetical protein
MKIIFVNMYILVCACARGHNILYIVLVYSFLLAVQKSFVSSVLYFGWWTFFYMMECVGRISAFGSESTQGMWMLQYSNVVFINHIFYLYTVVKGEYPNQIISNY